MVSPINHHRTHIHIPTTTTLFTVVTAIIHIHIRIHTTIPSSSVAITPSTAISNGEAYQPY
jgi:hypothetical protein